MTIQTKEHDLQRTILDYLALHRVWHRRLNTGAAPYISPAGRKRFVRFGKPGDPDIIAYRRPYLVAIEVKGTRGKLSPEQREFSEIFKQLGGIYVVARRLEDVSELFDKLPASTHRDSVDSV